MKIYVISRPSLDLAELKRYLADNGVSEWFSTSDVDAERIVEVGGRICYDSFSKPRPGGNAAYIENILDSKHGAVIEHANFTLLFTGVSRSLTHEFVRHRVGFSYSQRSQRYVDESGSDFVPPPAIVDDPDLMHLWQEATEFTSVIYKKISDKIIANQSAKAKTQGEKTALRKSARGAARSVLPNSISTQIMVTANARAWRHFVALRGAMPAEDEIRQLACNVARIMKTEAPNLFMDVKVGMADDKKEAVFVQFEKV